MDFEVHPPGTAARLRAVDDIAHVADLVLRLRALARHEHDDVSVADEAADMIIANYVPLACLPPQ